MKLRRVRLPFVSVMVDIVFPFRKMSTKPDQAQGASSPGRKVSLTSRPYVVHIRLTPHTVWRSGLHRAVDPRTAFKCFACAFQDIACGLTGRRRIN